MMLSRTLHKAAPPATPAEWAAMSKCALQLRKIGDKTSDLRQKILNLLRMLFCPETSSPRTRCAEK
ncbi:LOW QUALITY PROTEIN: phorbol-12-myristate-13-acetate-induced protein 1-like [Falco peregrinus]|uniref:LOW QUALITY PROTEIN: phorbol-12-myristate-13-acetate-induced protein 1-like n=1 Tax=Falco peregrinus TaxID=8954 RepID=UPI002479EC7D|nr:LOW QUALITY PROTEIN: phorbol-12-myristate-13-acetate-induced protein 1-like [Falco peregrinus]XP_055649074.1 LOW QUALITY PROTEIN: phorbol-12-myristate-13-acetate-induced protein 1-like [Falco peregrinus]